MSSLTAPIPPNLGPACRAGNTELGTVPAELLGAGPDSVGACWGCKITCWVVAVAVAMLVTLGTAFIVVGAGPVVSLVGLMASIGVALSEAGAVIVLQTLLAGAGATVAIIVLNMCTWVNACPNGVTAAITSPTAGTTVSGTTGVVATATNAATVAFYVAQQTLVGTATTGPNWTVDWDTTKISNGGHTVSALATGSTGAAWSPPVRVEIQN